MANHRLSRMSGRDLHESHRVSTPLELLFDLTFALAFGLAGTQVAHVLAEGHFLTALAGYAFAAFAICWAWVNFSWFASAYDTDDWIYRILTMIQMVGVLVLAMGLKPVFDSIDHGTVLDNRILVMGYVIMRLALVAQWLRAAKQDPKRRRVAMTYVVTLLIAQVLWVVIALIDLPIIPTFLLMLVPYVIELSGPFLAEQKDGGTPWHPHHIAERYGLLTIIALGECVIGTLASVSAFVDSEGWNADAILLCVAGLGLTFGMWWIYFVVPAGELLHRHRERSFFWGYFHMVIFAAIAATGAGLHVAGLYIEHEAHITAVETVLTVAVPVALYVVSLFILYMRLTASNDLFHFYLSLGTITVLALSVLLAYLGVPMTYCLIALMCAPAVTVLGYELRGYRDVARVTGESVH
ncbi:low temperature requirement protein A [Aestuariivirga sp.]|uniref:low temperature requirement protein A n=1 Tax=Aestuariivirga sp. TaxID=2650926 RepID=UPI0039E3D5E3